MSKITRLNPLLEVLRTHPQRVNKIFIQGEEGRGRAAEVLRLARAHRIPCVFVPLKKLDSLDPHHQGIAAFVGPKAFVPLSDILGSAARPFLLLLDGVEDPQNLGAIIRTAEGAGVDGIILPERRSAGLTDAVFSASAGALEHTKVCRVKNLSRTMEDLKRRGIWLVGAEGGRDKLWHEFDYTLPLALVFGSEGRGLRLLTRKRCDVVLSLPLCGEMSSLNVASAAAVFLYEVVRQRQKKRKQDE